MNHTKDVMCCLLFRHSFNSLPGLDCQDWWIGHLQQFEFHFEEIICKSAKLQVCVKEFLLYVLHVL